MYIKFKPNIKTKLTCPSNEHCCLIFNQLCTDQADRQLFCVGYWLEDMKSYMITYDMEDAVSAFRCWVSVSDVFIDVNIRTWSMQPIPWVHLRGLVGREDIFRSPTARAAPLAEGISRCRTGIIFSARSCLKILKSLLSYYFQPHSRLFVCPCTCMY